VTPKPPRPAGAEGVPDRSGDTTGSPAGGQLRAVLIGHAERLAARDRATFLAIFPATAVAPGGSGLAAPDADALLAGIDAFVERVRSGAYFEGWGGRRYLRAVYETTRRPNVPRCSTAGTPNSAISPSPWTSGRSPTPAVARQPGDHQPTACLDWIDTLARDGRLADAAAAAREALTIAGLPDQRAADVADRLATLDQRLGDPAGALDASRIAWRSHPTRPRLPALVAAAQTAGALAVTLTPRPTGPVPSLTGSPANCCCSPDGSTLPPTAWPRPTRSAGPGLPTPARSCGRTFW